VLGLWLETKGKCQPMTVTLPIVEHLQTIAFCHIQDIAQKKNTIEPSPKGKSELVEAFDER